MNPSTAQAEVIVDELVRGGVEHAVLAPGSRSAALAMALHADERIRLHVEIDERSAGFLAVGIGKADGSPAVVVTTSGTAVANLLPAVVEADASRVPLVVLSADRPPESRDIGANQTIDQVGVFGGYARACTDMEVAADRPGVTRYWRSVVARALGRARGAGESPPGPVHLNAPFREPLVPDPGTFTQPLDGRDGGRPWTVARVGARLPAADDVAAVRSLGGSRGVVVLGDGADAAPWLALAEAAGWPVLPEPLSGGRRPGTISTYDLLLRDASFAEAHRPEVAVVAGRVALSNAVRQWLDPGVEQVFVDPAGSWVDPGRAVHRVVAAREASLVEAVLRGGFAPAAREWSEAWRAAEAQARAALDCALDAEDRPTEPRVARDLAAWLPDDGALVAASSMPVRDLDLAMAPRSPLRVLGNRGASGIDGFVSTALGVAVVSPGPTVALAGDLSLLHDQNGLLLERRPDLTIVVLNNSGGAIFSFLPQARFPDGFERVFTTPHGVDLGAFASAHRCAHTALESAAGLAAALDAGVAGGGVHIVEVRTDREANVALHRRLADEVSRAVNA